MSRIDRRMVLRTLAYGLGAATLGRAVAACSQGTTVPGVGRERDDDDPPPKQKAPSVPTDQDEHVPGTSTPVDTGDAPPTIPMPSWEARVKQLENDQKRLYGREAFARGDEGVMAGKANSHEPRATLIIEDGTVRVQVAVEHVMGTPKPDGGVPGYDAAAPDASDAEAGADGGGGATSDAAAAPPPPPEHFITTVYLKADVNGIERVVGLWEFDVTDPAPPTVRFTLPPGITSITAYEWCTLHGLWKAAPLAVG